MPQEALAQFPSAIRRGQRVNEPLPDHIDPIDIGLAAGPHSADPATEPSQHPVVHKRPKHPLPMALTVRVARKMKAQELSARHDPQTVHVGHDGSLSVSQAADDTIGQLGPDPYMGCVIPYGVVAAKADITGSDQVVRVTRLTRDDERCDIDLPLMTAPSCAPNLAAWRTLAMEALDYAGVNVGSRDSVTSLRSTPHLVEVT